ncbi:MAG TPA: shikimate dehydrogenase [Candidatus Binataceae bacterium]|nr:shikimate dehydrogenase [Candidatus Binataceae bacterium]
MKSAAVPVLERATCTLSGTTEVAGVIGDPIAHSLSPVMHNAAYAALAMNRVYVPFHVPAAGLKAALRGVVGLGILGVNITVPHKERAARQLSELSDEARLLGVVNCIVNRAGRLVGDNTDARGLQLDLQRLGTRLRGRQVVLIGAGGGAASALLALQRAGVERVYLANRTRARAVRLGRRFPSLDLEIVGLADLANPSLIASAAAVINATSIGLQGEPFPELAYDAASDDCLFYDLIYRRETTSFLKPARARGLATADGIGMLLGQGVIAFELINGVAAPEPAMREALWSAVGRTL